MMEDLSNLMFLLVQMMLKLNFMYMDIKRDDPKRLRSFRARFNCDNPGPKWKARYWSCYQWRANAPVDG